MAELTAGRIRELLLDFYQEHDAKRLAMGLDVYSMVMWTIENGLDALNELLEDQYGATIDPGKKLGGQEQAMRRFSKMIDVPDSADRQMKNHIRQKLVDFYKQHDETKLNRVDDFVEYILLHSVEAFNRKLITKYGVGIQLDGKFAETNRYGSTRYVEDARGSVKMSKPPTLPSRPQRPEKPQEDEEDDLPPPPPPPTDSMMKDEGGDAAREVLKKKLEGYYAIYDPEKLSHLDSIVEWGMTIGEVELEGKLIQLYGSGFNPGSATGPRPEKAEKEKKKKEGPVKALRNSLKGAFSSSKATPMSPEKFQARQKPVKPTPPKLKKPSFTGASAPSKPAPPSGKKNIDNAAIYRANATVSDGRDGDVPCNNYELDLTGASFGMCKCGFSRLAHVKGSSEYRAAMEARRVVGGKGRPKKKPSATQQQLPMGVQPTAGSYMLMTTAESKPSRSTAHAKAGASEKGFTNPCNNFKLDLAGTSYGVCANCGFARDKHNYKAQLERMDSPYNR